MKKLLFFILATSFVVNAQHFHPVPHVNSFHPTVHVTPHVNSFHPTTTHISEPVHITKPAIVSPKPMNVIQKTPIYNPIKKVPESEFKIHHNGSYYYLLMNNHTKRFDTIKGATKEELRTKLGTQKEQKNTLNKLIIVGTIVGIILLVLFIAITFQDKKEKTWEEAVAQIKPKKEDTEI